MKCIGRQQKLLLQSLVGNHHKSAGFKTNLTRQPEQSGNSPQRYSNIIFEVSYASVQKFLPSGCPLPVFEMSHLMHIKPPLADPQPPVYLILKGTRLHRTSCRKQVLNFPLKSIVCTDTLTTALSPQSHHVRCIKRESSHFRFR
jgi:hypothetical protein